MPNELATNEFEIYIPYRRSNVVPLIVGIACFFAFGIALTMLIGLFCQWFVAHPPADTPADTPPYTLVNLLWTAGFIAPICLVLLLALFGWFQSRWGIRFLAYLGSYFLVIAPINAIRAYSAPALMTIRTTGLFLPFSYIAFLRGGGGKTFEWCPWEHLKAIDIRREHREDAYLSLEFRSRKPVLLPIASFDDNTLRQFLSAVETFAPECSIKEDVQNLHSSLLITASDQSYTNLWELELGRRFNSTVFTPLAPSTTLCGGKYKILRQLAFGGFAAIYLAEQLKEHTPYIVKELVVPADKTLSKAKELFEREARILLGLNHPQIVKLLDHFTDGDRFYQILEYIPGMNLRQIVKTRGRQEERQVILLAEQMLHILEYLHSQKPPVMHRDFTPDNLILDSDNILHLIDFGAANEILSNLTGTLIGKSGYMPIEQLRGLANTKSDLYALGCTLSFLLTGNDPVAMTQSSCKLQNESVSQALHDFIECLTEQDQSLRPENAAVALQSLARLRSTLITGP